MQNRIYYSQEALHDMDEIWDYISFELCNPKGAERTVGKIMDAIDCLGDFSNMGAPLSSIIAIVTDYRFLVSGNYMIFYRVDNDAVYIDRVLYGKRNYLSILFPELLEKDMEE